ncbi:hypothetical protein PMAYCL1PPCAC_14406, partial [Pristionchus mayeri]
SFPSPTHPSLPPPNQSVSPSNSVSSPSISSPTNGPPPSKSARTSIPASTPRARAATGSRARLRPPSIPAEGLSIDITVYWKGKLAEKDKLLAIERKQKHLLGKYLSGELVEQECESRLHPVDSSSAGFATVVREIPRYLSTRSAGAHREHKEWMEFMKLMGIQGGTIPSLAGHRFNIHFFIAARVFSLRDHIKKFIEYAPTMAFLNDLLDDELVLVQLQILGLLDQKITGPLWRIAENVGVIEGAQYHRDILAYIDDCIDSPALFFSGECPRMTTPPSFELFKVDGTLFKALVTNSPSSLALEVSVRVLRACATYLRDVLSQSLPGGSYSNPSDSVAQCVQSAPTTNRAAESAFAFMDYLYRKSPNMRFFRRDAITCFRLNHVGEWLDGKSTSERTMLLEKALRCRDEIVRDERKQVEQLGEEIVSKMVARKEENDGKALKGDIRRAKLTTDLGLLDTDTKIDSAIFPYQNAVDVIKAQIRYRKQVVERSAHPGLYRFSGKGVAHNLQTLVSNLKEIVAADSIAGALEEDAFRHSLLGRTFRLTDDVQLPDGMVLSS